MDNKKRALVTTAAVGWAIALVGAGATATGALGADYPGGWFDDEGPAAVIPDAAAPESFQALPNYGFVLAEEDPQPGAPNFTEEEATARMGAVGASALAETHAVEQVAPDTGAPIPPVLVDGAPIELGDLSLVEVRFEPSNTAYTTAAGTFGGFLEPTDAWIAVWQRVAVPAPEWDNIETTINVVVVMEDGTGVIHSVHSSKINPNAVAPEED